MQTRHVDQSASVKTRASLPQTSSVHPDIYISGLHVVREPGVVQKAAAANPNTVRAHLASLDSPTTHKQTPSPISLHHPHPHHHTLTNLTTTMSDL
jgi:hypothetical protein